KAHDRMLALKRRTSREEIAHRIADAVGDILPYIDQAIEWNPIFKHIVRTVQLPANWLTKVEMEGVVQDYKKWQAEYKKERQKIKENPELRGNKRWYVALTYARGRMHFYQHVMERFNAQENHEK